MSKVMGWVAVAVMAWGAGLSAGAQASNGDVNFTNNSDHAVWVTLYRGRGRDVNLARGCVAGGGGTLTLTISQQTMRSVGWEGGYYPLWEIKESKTSCADHSNKKALDDVKQTAAHWVMKKEPIFGMRPDPA